MFAAVTQSGITSRALDAGLWALTTWNPRDFTTDNYRTVDDRPYGGGPGMGMAGGRRAVGGGGGVLWGGGGQTEGAGAGEGGGGGGGGVPPPGGEKRGTPQ